MIGQPIRYGRNIVVPRINCVGTVTVVARRLQNDLDLGRRLGLRLKSGHIIPDRLVFLWSIKLHAYQDHQQDNRYFFYYFHHEKVCVNILFFVTEKELHIALNSDRLSKAQVDLLVRELVDRPELAEFLFQEVMLEDKEGTFNASWTFDHLMRKNLSLILPFFDDFTAKLGQLRTESCIRPIAHVCEMVCIAYFKKKDPFFMRNITDNQLERMMTVCF